MSPLQLTLVFFSVTLVAFVFHRRRWVRPVYLLVLFALFCAPGFTGRWTWPFFSWHLYAFEASEELIFHEIRVADAQGREIKYDARAIKPSLATPVRRYAAAIGDWKERDAVEFARFLIRRGNEYRRRMLAGESESWLKFPPHQIGFRWPVDPLREMGPWEEIRVYRVRIRFSADGREQLERVDELLESYR